MLGMGLGVGEMKITQLNIVVAVMVPVIYSVLDH